MAQSHKVCCQSHTNTSYLLAEARTKNKGRTDDIIMRDSLFNGKHCLSSTRPSLVLAWSKLSDICTADILKRPTRGYRYSRRVPQSVGTNKACISYDSVERTKGRMSLRPCQSASSPLLTIPGPQCHHGPGAEVNVVAALANSSRRKDISLPALVNHRHCTT